MADRETRRANRIFVGLKSLCEYHGITGIRDGWLRQLSANPKRSLSELTAALPNSLVPLAGEIWEIMSQPFEEAGSEEAGEEGSQPSAVPGPGGTGDPNNDHAARDGETPEARNRRLAQEAVDAENERDPQVLADLSDPELLREKIDDLLARMDYSQDVEENPAILNFRVTRNGTALRWRVPRGDEQVSVYRVVSTYENPASNPDSATTLALTLGTEVSDPRPVDAALRYYQVWSYSGESMEDIAWSQPQLLAEAAVCAEPEEVHAVDEGGRVILKWRLPQGATRASVYRMPQSRYAQIRPRDEDYRIQPEGAHLSGLQDMDVDPGTAYVYHVHTEVEMGQIVHHSPAATQSVTTRARVLPVTDLACQKTDTNGESSFDLVWTAPPAGEVHIYRTEAAPPSGIVDQVTLEKQLPQDVFTAKGRLPHPDSADADGRRRMPQVEWDDEWARVYFTPVTFLDGRVAVGQTISQVRTQAVTDVHIHERLHEQILTLRWPESADEVQVFLTAPNDTNPSSLAHQQPSLVCKKGKYRKDGLIALGLVRDCTVHLVPVIFSEGEAIMGESTTVAYRRPWQVHYDLQIKRRLVGDAVGELSVASGDRFPVKPSFVLVHNPIHLPLHADDGSKVEVTPVSEQPIPPSSVFSPPSLEAEVGTYKFSFSLPRKATGFVRVFAYQLPDEQFDKVAVLDPPIPRLRLS